MSEDAEYESEVSHLRCEECEERVGVARRGDRAVLVCHCTHDDGTLDPVYIDEMAILPGPWEFREQGGGSMTHSEAALRTETVHFAACHDCDRYEWCDSEADAEVKAKVHCAHYGHDTYTGSSEVPL